ALGAAEHVSGGGGVAASRAVLGAGGIDPGVHGDGADAGDGGEPAAGCAAGRGEPADGAAGDPERGDEAGVLLGGRGGVRGGVCPGVRWLLVALWESLAAGAVDAGAGISVGVSAAEAV